MKIFNSVQRGELNFSHSKLSCVDVMWLESKGLKAKLLYTSKMQSIITIWSPAPQTSGTSGWPGEEIWKYQTWINWFLNKEKLTVNNNNENFTCCQSVLPVASCLTTSATSVTPILGQVGQISLWDSQDVWWRASTWSPNLGGWVPFPESHGVGGFQGVKVYSDAVWDGHLDSTDRPQKLASWWKTCALKLEKKQHQLPHRSLHISFQWSQNCHRRDERYQPGYLTLVKQRRFLQESMTRLITCVRDWLSWETIGAKSGLFDRGRREHLGGVRIKMNDFFRDVIIIGE